MLHADEVKRQLIAIGATNLMWGRAELRELPKILFEGEVLQHVLNGRYEGGFAVMCATNLRVILVDKKPFFLTLEDTRYEMISDVQFNHRLIDASVWIGTVHKKMVFRAFHHSKLRTMAHYIQQQAMVSRQQQQWQQTEYAASPNNQLLSSLASDSNAVEGEILPQKVIEGAFATIKRPPVNPYKMPVMIRHRVSRFY